MSNTMTKETLRYAIIVVLSVVAIVLFALLSGCTTDETGLSPAQPTGNSPTPRSSSTASASACGATAKAEAAGTVTNASVSISCSLDAGAEPDSATIADTGDCIVVPLQGILVCL